MPGHVPARVLPDRVDRPDRRPKPVRMDVRQVLHSDVRLEALSNPLEQFMLDGPLAPRPDVVVRRVDPFLAAVVASPLGLLDLFVDPATDSLNGVRPRMFLAGDQALQPGVFPNGVTGTG